MTTGAGDPAPEQTDNRPRPEDGPQDVPQDGAPVTGDADEVYAPVGDGDERES